MPKLSYMTGLKPFGDPNLQVVGSLMRSVPPDGCKTLTSTMLTVFNVFCKLTYVFEYPVRLERPRHGSFYSVLLNHTRSGAIVLRGG